MPAHRRHRSASTRRRDSQLWPVLAYTAGVWLAFTVWAASAQHVLPGQGRALSQLSAFAWVYAINLLPAALAACGFAMGLAWLARTRRSKPVEQRFAPWLVALAVGLIFPLCTGVLLPLFAALRLGLWPALLWCVLGSMMAALCFQGLRRKPKENA